MQLVANPRQYIKSLTILFPFYTYGTQERVSTEGEVACAETVANIMSACMPLTQSGPSKLCIYDIHALPVRFYFVDNVVPKMLTGIDLLLEEFKNRKPYIVAFPDDGAKKRFGCFFKDYPIIVCSKIREGDKRIVRIVESIGFDGTFKEDDHVIIVDDLVQSGATLYETYLALNKVGAKKVSAYVTHAVFPNEGHLRFIEGGDRQGFETFFVTDTVPEVTSKLIMKPFKVLSIANDIADNALELVDMKFDYNIHSPKIMVHLASHSSEKREAVVNAFKKFNVPPKFINSIEIISSGVSEQPIGTNEIMDGATFRMKKIEEVVNMEPDYDNYFVSIENGIINDDKPYDVAFIMIKKINKIDKKKIDDFPIATNLPIQKSKLVTVQSDKVFVDKELVTKSIQSGKKITVGKLIHQSDPSVNPSDWHLKVAGVSRIKLMQDAIEMALHQLD